MKKLQLQVEAIFLGLTGLLTFENQPLLKFHLPHISSPLHRNKRIEMRPYTLLLLSSCVWIDAAPRRSDNLQDVLKQISISEPDHGNLVGPRPCTLHHLRHTIARLESASTDLIVESIKARENTYLIDRYSRDTVYETLVHTGQTGKLLHLLDRVPHLVSALQSKNGPYTIFAPIDAAFVRGHSQQLVSALDHFELEDLIRHHISPHDFPMSRIMTNPTIPTLLQPENLNGPQRVHRDIIVSSQENSWMPEMFVKLNRAAIVVQCNIFASNGIIHLIDTVLMPPAPAYEIIQSLPSDFSTFQRALTHTGLGNELRNIMHDGSAAGSTIFAPSNRAFRNLGLKMCDFLFSEAGMSHLRTLLKRHIIVNKTLFSNALYTELMSSIYLRFPKGYRHFELKTLASDGDNLQVDIARYGGFIVMVINKVALVEVQDLIASDGVVHVIDRVLIP